VTLGRAEVVALLERHGIRPSRALGQHFLVDPGTARRIARLAELSPGEPVVEIGAGLGSLTLALAEAGACVTAGELDRRRQPALCEVASRCGATVVAADARRLDWEALLAGAERWSLVANLPYNVATPLVVEVLERARRVQRMLVMVQREVAERLAAPAGHPAYGAVSAKVAYWARAEVVGRVPPGVFLPRPKVDSALVRISRRDEPAVPGSVDYEALFALVRAGFGKRRKMLRRALAGQVDAAAFAAAGVPPEGRAEDLDVVAWGRLAAAAARGAS
jgi:16S rRNA (adenine1518-N6/adenine1519-N6)-dimethyltransferase